MLGKNYTKFKMLLYFYTCVLYTNMYIQYANTFKHYKFLQNIQIKTLKSSIVIKVHLLVNSSVSLILKTGQQIYLASFILQRCLLSKPIRRPTLSKTALLTCAHRNTHLSVKLPSGTKLTGIITVFMLMSTWHIHSACDFFPLNST